MSDATVPFLDTPHLHMPRLGFGTWPMKGAECQAAVESALGLGYRHLDTAEMYGNEAEVGAAIRSVGLAREALFVTSKVWHEHLAPAALRAAAEASLGRLGLDQLDLYLIHWPAPGMDVASAIAALVAVKDAGLARAVGVSNFPSAMLRAALASGAPLACIQVEYHALLSQAAVLSVARPAGMVLTAYSPLARGLLNDHPALRPIAAKHGCTPAQVALAWLLGQEAVAAIPKAANPDRQRENLGALAVRLDAADLATIAALPKDQRQVAPGFAPRWDLAA